MVLLVLISVLFSVFRASVGNSEYVDLSPQNTMMMITKERIFLIENTNEHNKEFNDIFEKVCGNYYAVERGHVEESYQYPYVINFAVPGSYNYNNNILEDNFVNAGSITDPNKINCTIMHNEIYCKETANLVSISLTKLDDGSVLELVQSLTLDSIHSLTEDSCRPQFKSIAHLNTVLICQSLKREIFWTLKQRFFMFNLIQIDDDSSCDEAIRDNQHRLLAILRPEPKSDTLVPTVLLRTPYIASEMRTGLPNSKNLIPWKLLKFGIVKFIQNVGWRRVVVVSDDSEYSVDFEKELTDLLHREKIVYTTVRCDGAVCSLESLLKILKKVSPKIVIANLKKSYDLHHLITNFNLHTTWILRDVEDADMIQLNKQDPHRRNLFSVSLRAYTKETDYRCGMEDDIRAGVEAIAYAYKNTNITSIANNMKKKKFYSLIAEKMNELKRNEAVVCVKNLFKNNLVSTMYVNATGAKVHSFKQPFKKVPEDGPFCLAYSNKYFYPCDNVLPLVYMCVIVMFFITVLWLACYFDKTTPLNRNNYYRHFD
ncbi:hypothetical protein HW555_002124 [Spodoptera exigua]|uniref:Receptor ligand binding region domain-containing protein n=1 Tax=Spodoptera exigua TaxID=7107 RepID=A0A835GSR6_SPOEX|nr:hypothetical protein HW555_002124 [Spodoptera exigua]